LARTAAWCVVPAPDRGRGSGDCDEPRGDALLHDDAEAAQLVLQSVALPESAGKVALLDMGTPVAHLGFGERLIRMSGLRPRSGYRDRRDGTAAGEKLHEELWWNAENATPSSHPQIMLGDVGGPVSGTRALVPLIRELVEKDDSILLHQLLEERVGLTNGVHAVPIRSDRGTRRRGARLAAARR